MSWISRTHYHNERVENEFRKNQNSDQVSHVWICQEHTDISEIDRILLKIHHEFC